MKFGSLFTGVGGFDLGFERAGMECTWQVEFDKACQNVLRKHWSETELFDDVRTVGKHNLKPVDVICGGFPCQDVSIAGKRAGLAGERSGLWHEFARIIDELEPKWVVIENVPGLLSSNKGQDFATVIRWLAERGYGVAWRILDSQYFGVAQRRRRVFVVASFGNGSASEILFESEGVRWNTEKGRKTGEDIAYSIRANPSHSCDKGDGGINQTLVMSSGQPQWVNQVASTFTIRTRSEGGGKGYLGLDDGAMTLGGQPQWVMTSGQAKAEIMSERSPALTGLHEQPIVMAYENHPADSRITETGDISQQLTSRMGTCGGNVPLVQEIWNAQNRIEFYKDPISPTLQSRMGTGGNNVPLIGVRRLTPTECERLQGFPDGWTDGQADMHRYKQMGNAVTVNVAAWIGKRIVEVAE